uniref:ATP synthase subunit a n=3 Tax=Linophrynidae TaxID=242963 RepID=D3KS81_9TELE|nr:ATP synthase F0 subunit 6 [Linophryne sp. LMS8E]BAI77318.1 ATPase subunit 6 [Linophryne bicornis]BAI77331.1 ATPase subunit 6 [Acentrophryne dolichonema]
MVLNLFSQFESPSFLGVPLMTLALLLPITLVLSSCRRWLTNRLMTLQNWLLARFNFQLLKPLNFRGHKWALMLTSLVVYLTSMNVLGLLPYTFTPTTQLSLNIGLAFPLWAATVSIGVRKQPTTAFGHMLARSTPNPLIPILILVETMSWLLRPLALGIRITANLTAGHLLIHLISAGALALLPSMPTVAALATIVLMLLMVLETAVALIQAYVFVLLLSLYLQENT